MSRNTPRRPSRKVARIAGVGVVAAGLVGSAALVWQASYSAFSSQTTTPADNWTAGSVSLSNDTSASALFSVTGLKPGMTGTKCIVVSSTGSLASTVKMYVTAGTFAQTNTLADNMTLTVTQGTSSSVNGNCAGWSADTGTGTSVTGSLSSFASGATSITNFSNGFGTWAPTAASAGSPVKKTYQFTYTLNNAASQALTDAMQNGTAAVGFTWEAQNS
jgi:hypothetical protein